MCFLRFNFFPQRRQAVSDCRPPYLRLFIRELSEQEKKLRNATKASKLGIQKIRVEDAIILFRQSQNVPKSKSWIS